MYIYKLRYNDRATAINDLIAKGVLLETTDLNNNTTIVNTSITQAVVELGIIVLTSGTYDEDFNEITAPKISSGSAKRPTPLSCPVSLPTPGSTILIPLDERVEMF